MKRKKPLAPPQPNLKRLFLVTALGTLGGALLLALGAWGLGKRDLALGFLIGGFLAPLNLFALGRFTGKALTQGATGLEGRFFLKWVLFALVGFLLLRVSLSCLLGALLSYTWFLALLAWRGIQEAPRKRISPGQDRP